MMDAGTIGTNWKISWLIKPLLPVSRNFNLVMGSSGKLNNRRKIE